MLKKLINPFEKLIYDKNQVIDLIQESIQGNKNLLVTYFNQHCFNIFQIDEQYRNILLNDAKYYLDGIGVWMALKIFGKKNIAKFNASEINEILFDYLVVNNKPIILIGGNFTKELISKSKLNIELYLNGYEDIGNLKNCVRQIKNCQASCIIIGTGVPKQEILAAKLHRILNSSQIICVGNFLEFYFGTKKRAPKYLHNSGFEWVYRIITEPKRLWKRYIIGIPIFIIWIIFILIFYKRKLF